MLKRCMKSYQARVALEAIISEPELLANSLHILSQLILLNLNNSYCYLQVRDEKIKAY